MRNITLPTEAKAAEQIVRALSPEHRAEAVAFVEAVFGDQLPPRIRDWREDDVMHVAAAVETYTRARLVEITEQCKAPAPKRFRRPVLDPVEEFAA